MYAVPAAPPDAKKDNEWLTGNPAGPTRKVTAAIIPQSDGSFHGGRGFFGRLELPLRSGRGGRVTVIKTFVGGYFVDNFKAPCNEDAAAQSSDPTCKNWKTMQNATYDKFMGGALPPRDQKGDRDWPSS